MNTHITGRLISAGDYEVQVDPEKPLARVVIVMPSDVLRDVKTIPFYKEVVIVTRKEWEQLNAR